MSIICILGRQPALGLAELESRFGADKVRPLGSQAAWLDVEPAEFNIDHFGGVMKAARLLTELPGTNWRDMHEYLVKTTPEHVQYVPEGKLKIGLSAYNLTISPREINHTGLSIKKAIKATDRSVRIVPNVDKELSTATVLHNQLTGPTGWELVLFGDKNRTILAQTFGIQNIEAYAARDQARPKRDAKVGMLPPKLAQIIINLAVGQIEGIGDRVRGAERPVASKPSTLPPSPYPLTILDPFCGTGVILQEAVMMGFDVYGSDIDPRMVEYSDVNLKWLQATLHTPVTEVLSPDGRYYSLEVADATTHTWKYAPQFVAAETYLGQPYTVTPPPDQLAKNMTYVDRLHHQFLSNIGRQLKPGTRLSLAVPAWRSGNQFKHLSVLNHLPDLGYQRLTFKHARQEDLVYWREGQQVGRELIVLQKT